MAAKFKNSITFMLRSCLDRVMHQIGKMKVNRDEDIANKIVIKEIKKQ